MPSITSLVKRFAPQIIAFRRDIHTYPELGWLEYRTTSKIAELFQNLGYEVVLGSHAIDAASRLTPPSSDLCARHKARAIIQGARPDLVERMGDGLTGLWVDIEFGKKNAGTDAQHLATPVLAFRFDMDANGIEESTAPDHIPVAQGFNSQNGIAMHACGHDGHVAMGIGLGLALHALAQERPAEFQGTVRLIFQPAEEIGQGAKAMVASGVMDCVQEVYGMHVGIQAQKPGILIGGTTHFLANTTFEVTFEGQAAHSGLAPQEGRNALLAATTAIQGMHSIARHGKGETRINIGQLEVHGAPNVVPCKAFLVGETRAVHGHINAWMTEEVQRICQGAAHMWDCSCHFRPIGACVNGYSHVALAKQVCQIAHTMPCFDTIVDSEKFMASEDFTWFLEEVEKNGGQGTFIQLGVALRGGHHNSCFDFDEEALLRGVELLLRIIDNKLR